MARILYRMREMFFCFILLTLIGCRKKCDHHFLVGTHSRFPSDTCYFCQKETVRNDSFILDCNTGNSFSQLFIFNLKDRSKAYCSGGTGSKDLYLNGKIIKRGNNSVFKYIADTTITHLGRNYQVYKYLYDEEYASDARCNYYWVPEFGIIYFGNPVSNYRLHTSDTEINRRIGLAVKASEHWKTD